MLGASPSRRSCASTAEREKVILPAHSGRSGLQLDDDEAPELKVKEDRVEKEAFAIDCKMHLAAHEGEATPELQKKVPNVLDESACEVALLRLGPAARSECGGGSVVSKL